MFVRGGFAEVDATKVVVLAEEAVLLDSADVEDLESRIRDAEEDLTIAKSDSERARAVEQLDYLHQLRAAVAARSG
jgi:F-type H+-transporting ATPase subunit epsilon